MFEEAQETIEVRDPINLDELTFSLIVDYHESIRELIKRSENKIERSDILCSMFKVPFGMMNKKTRVTLKIFRGLYHRDILAAMEKEGYFGANIFEATKFSMKYPHIQHQIPIFVPAERGCNYYNNDISSIYFSVNKYGEKIISRDVIYFNDRSKNVETIYLLGVKVEEIMEE